MIKEYEQNLVGSKSGYCVQVVTCLPADGLFQWVNTINIQGQCVALVQSGYHIIEM